MNKKEILADLEQIKSSLEELETQRDDIQILCIKSELELSIGNILSDYKRILEENEDLKREIKKQKDINTIINKKGLDKNYENALEKTMAKFLNDNIANEFLTKQKIKDKIEELKQKAINYGNFIDKDESFNIESKISILKELLGDK